MLLKWAILPTVIIFHCVRAYDSDDDETNSCIQTEEFDLADMQDAITFSGKATCREYQKIFKFNPDPNAKRGRVLSIPTYSGYSYLSFHIAEFTTYPNGTIDRMLTRPGEIMADKKWFAPTTGILVNFTRSGGRYYDIYTYSFEGTIATTAANHHCPYPFIDLQPNVPVVIEETVVMYKCDVVVTAPQGHVVRIDHINDTSAVHETAINVYEDNSLIERFDTFPVEETITGAGAVRIGIAQKSDQSHQIAIQISAVKLNCTCGPSEVFFNATMTPITFQTPGYPKRHCKKLSCPTTFKLPTELRQKYKIKMERFGTLSYGVIDIDEGANGIGTLNDRLTRSFTFESPSVTFKYIPSGTQRDVFSIELGLAERQQGCDCPHQRAIGRQFALEIPAHCKQLDCLYELPQFDDATVKYLIQRDTVNDYIGSRLTGAKTDRFSYNSGKGTFEYSAWANKKERMIFRYHRENPTRTPTIFAFNYTTSGVHISHAERCGCANKTVLLQSNNPEEVSSPDWPAHYCNNLVCLITYIAPTHHHLQVQLDTISLEPDSDSVAFFDGSNITENPLKLVTGELLSSDRITSSSTVLTAFFVSNGAVSFDGFNGTITAVMDKSWSDHLKQHISGWWWIFAIFLCFIVGIAIFVLKRKGLRRPRNINLMDL